MKRLVVVKAARTHGTGRIELEQGELLDNLIFSLLQLLMQHGIKRVRVISGASDRSRASAERMATLATEGKYLPMSEIDRETLSNTFPLTLNIIMKQESYEVVILVCEGNIADCFSAYYASRVRGLHGLDDDPIIPTCSRVLDCDTGALALVY